MAPKRRVFDEPAVCQAYLSGLTIRQVARQFRTGDAVIHRVLSENEVPRRRGGWADKSGHTPKRPSPPRDRTLPTRRELTADAKTRAATHKLVQRMREYQPGSYA